MVGFARSRATRNERLDVFDMPATDMSISARREVRINPKTTGINPITFEVDPMNDFLDMDSSFVELDLTVKKSDNGNLAAADVLVLANNLAHSLFRQISVRLNGTLMAPQTDNYHHQAYIETLLNNDKQDGEDLLVPQGWYNCLDVPDDGENGEFTANSLDTATPHADYTALPESRKKVVQARLKFLGGNKIVMRFTPNMEVFRMGKLLRPGIRLQMEMFLNNPNLWTIRHAGAVQLKLTNAEIQTRWYIYPTRVQPSVYREIIEAANKGKVMTYPVVRGDIRTYSHNGQVRYFECNNPFQGAVPNRLVVVMMKQEAYNGNITHNPFAYGKFNLSSAKLSVGGEEYPYETLELDYDSSNADLRGYHRFLEASGCLTRGHGNLVGPDDWGHGKKANLIVFDTTSNKSLDSPILNPKLTGDVRLVLNFGANPRANNGENLTILVYGEFENVVEIDGRGSVIYDITR